MKPPSNRCPGLFLCLLIAALASNSCMVMSWEVLAPPNQTSQTELPTNSGISVHFYIPEYLLNSSDPAKHFYARAPDNVYQTFQRRFASQIEFERAKVISTPPEKGLFCSIRVTEKDQPRLRSLVGLLNMLTLFLVPFYDDTLGYHVKYEVYVDAELKKRYEYHTNGKLLFWAAAPLAVPFMSGKWEIVMDPYGHGKGGWPDELEEALWSTVRMFLRDAHRDGLL